MHDTTEEYLETIFEIEEEGIVPIRARLVERLRDLPELRDVASDQQNQGLLATLTIAFLPNAASSERESRAAVLEAAGGPGPHLS